MIICVPFVSCHTQSKGLKIRNHCFGNFYDFYHNVHYMHNFRSLNSNCKCWSRGSLNFLLFVMTLILYCVSLHSHYIVFIYSWFTVLIWSCDSSVSKMTVFHSQSDHFKIWRFLRSLECDTVTLGDWLSVFQGALLPSPARVSNPKEYSPL
jgi:hypothetical protein